MTLPSPLGFIAGLDLAASVDRNLRRNIQVPVRTLAAGVHSILDTDMVVLGDASAGAVTFNLPSAIGRAGFWYELKRKDATANSFTIAASGGQTIDGAATLPLTTQNQAVIIASDGANWVVLAGSTAGAAGGGIGAILGTGTQGSDQTATAGVITSIPGTSVTFSLASPQTVLVIGSCSGIRQQDSSLAETVMYYRVDGGADKEMIVQVLGVSGADVNANGPGAFIAFEALAAGSHTIELRYKATAPNGQVEAPIRIIILATASAVPTQQFDTNKILAARMLGDRSEFFSLPGGLTVRLLASTSDPFIYGISSNVHTVTSDVDLTVTDAAHNFIWIDSSGVTGRSALPCIYSFQEPSAPATDQHWFDLGHNQMKRFDGVSFVAVSRIFIGYVRADAGAINARFLCEPVGMNPYSRFETYGDGTDGFLDLTAGTTTLDGFKRYTFVCTRGGTITQTTDFDLPLFVKSQNGIIFLTGGLDLNAKGGAPGTGGITDGNDGAHGGLAAGGGGGGGGTVGDGGFGGAPSIASNPGGLKARAAGGTAGTPPTDGASGAAADYEPQALEGLMLFMKTPGGGGGGGDGTSAGADGGRGGGAAVLVAPSIYASPSPVIRADGQAGGAGPGATRGAGGGGPGGTILMACRNLLLQVAVSVANGLGGASGGANSGDGGNGPAGKSIRIRT